MDSLIITLLLGTILPALCYLIEAFIQKPEIIEELFKLLLVVILSKHLNLNTKKYQTVVLLGITFALSELFFYGTNYYISGNISLVIIRFLVTSFLHTLTYLLIVLGVTKQKKVYIALTFLISILIHYLFNFLLSV